MSGWSVVRWTGVLGLTAMVVQLVAIIVFSAGGLPPGFDDATKVLAYMKNGHFLFTTSLILFFIATATATATATPTTRVSRARITRASRPRSTTNRAVGSMSMRMATTVPTRTIRPPTVATRIGRAATPPTPLATTAVVEAVTRS